MRARRRDEKERISSPHDMHFAALEVEETAENAHEGRFATAVFAE